MAKAKKDDVQLQQDKVPYNKQKQSIYFWHGIFITILGCKKKAFSLL